MTNSFGETIESHFTKTLANPEEWFLMMLRAVPEQYIELDARLHDWLRARDRER